MLITAIIIIVLAFGISASIGAPYLPILQHDAEKLLNLSGLQPDDKLIDLGSGDGRLLKAAARRGIYGIGYEINPILFVISLLVTWPERRYVKIHLANYWQVKLPSADAVYVFLLNKYMGKLAGKLAREMDPRTLLVSYVFEIPNTEPLRRNHNTAVYSVEQLIKVAK